MIAMPQRYRHLWGLDGHFVRLDGRGEWWPLNDAAWQQNTNTPDNFYLLPEQTLGVGGIDPIPAPDKILAFRAAAQEIARKKLDAVAKWEIGRDLQAAQAGQRLERLIESIDYYLKQDDLYR